MENAKKPIPKGYVDLRRAAEMDGVSLSAIRGRVQRGTLPSIKVGGKRYVSAKSLLYQRRKTLKSYPRSYRRTGRQIALTYEIANALTDYSQAHGTSPSTVIQEALHHLLIARWPAYALSLAQMPSHDRPR